jgi:hypothetical protein
MLKRISIYWWCQIAGWETFAAINLFFALTFGKVDPLYFPSLFLTTLAGIFITHIMRWNILRINVLQKTLGKQILYLSLFTILFAILLGLASETIDSFIQYHPERLKKYSHIERIFLSSFSSLWLLLVWNMFYYIYHFVERNRRQQLDTLRLEAMVKSLELKTIKAHINPHFIFNSLNSIRALVDENPARARTAITELSNILRSSMQTEKVETVSLQQELSIVKDYLALEQIRFEDRLKIEFHISEPTLSQPIPPMMLQTLVENAIKHGVSKEINGGFVRIKSSYVDNAHQLIVQNSGSIGDKAHQNEEGFGIKSTTDRLNLLYSGQASFEIVNVPNEQVVQCTIIMPIQS